MKSRKSSRGVKSKKSNTAKGRSGSKKSSLKRPQYAKGDLIALILKDHQPLKKLISILKDEERDHSELKEAFQEFSKLLLVHAKPEEQVLYSFMKKDEELRKSGYEGEVEHGLAEQMIDEASRTENEDQWGARVKVLAELVEHHIEEEEDEMLPDFKKATDQDERESLGEEYLQAKEQFIMDQDDLADDDDSESENFPETKAG